MTSDLRGNEIYTRTKCQSSRSLRKQVRRRCEIAKTLQAESLQPSKEGRFPLPVAGARRQEGQENPRLHRLPGKQSLPRFNDLF